MTRRVIPRRDHRVFPLRLRRAFVIGWTFLLLPLAGCSQANQAVNAMDNFFDSLDGQPASQSSGIITGPGYAPAYPPYDSRPGPSASVR